MPSRDSERFSACPRAPSAGSGLSPRAASLAYLGLFGHNFPTLQSSIQLQPALVRESSSIDRLLQPLVCLTPMPASGGSLVPGICWPSVPAGHLSLCREQPEL